MSKCNLKISKDNLRDEWLITGYDTLNLDSTLHCGQAFRWKKVGSENVACVREELLAVEDRGSSLILHEPTDDKLGILVSYLRLEESHAEIEDRLSKMDDIMKEAVSYSSGLRLVDQEPFECLISYIISANNSIPLITRAINNISAKWGSERKYKGQSYFTFPSPQALKNATEEELFECKTGFRAGYLTNAIARVNTKELDLEAVKTMDYMEAKKALLEQKGVGDKVADCVLLFSMGKFEAFPVDIWIDRIVRNLYLNGNEVSKKKVREWGEARFKDLAGYAQEYLFAYAREKIPDLLRRS